MEDLNSEQLICMSELKLWVDTKAEFYGRNDPNFLRMFLHSCKFDLTLTKKTLNFYYKNRTLYPEWWANRDLEHLLIKQVLQYRFETALIDSYVDQPTVIVVRPSRFGTDSSLWNSLCKLHSIHLEVIARRRNCQLNGCVTVFDFKDCPWWFFTKLMWPPNCSSGIQAFLNSVPIRTVGVYCVNSLSFASAVFKVCQPFFSPEFRNKVRLFSDWSKLSEALPLVVLPDELGGTAGPLQRHEDAFIEELMSMNDFLLDDNKYGVNFR